MGKQDLKDIQEIVIEINNEARANTRRKIADRKTIEKAKAKVNLFIDDMTQEGVDPKIASEVLLRKIARDASRAANRTAGTYTRLDPVLDALEGPSEREDW